MDPYAGRKKISDESRIKDTVTAAVVRDLVARGVHQPGGSKPRKEKRKDKVKAKGALDKKCCPDFNSPSGCKQEECKKGLHKCSKRKGEYVCLRNHAVMLKDLGKPVLEQPSALRHQSTSPSQ